MSTTITASRNSYDLQPISRQKSTFKTQALVQTQQIGESSSHNQASRSDDSIHPLSPSTSHVLGTAEAVQEITSNQPAVTPLHKRRAGIVIVQLALTTFLISLSTGLIVVGLPRIAIDISLPAHLYLWPSSVFGLTTGSTLLLAGAIADVVGARSVELFACLLLGSFTLACGLSQTGIQLVVFRALQGVATAMHMPSAVSLIAQFVPSGKTRNIGFASLGVSMTMGFLCGLVLGGVLVDSIGWRSGFYISGGILLLQVAIGMWVIPARAIPSDVWPRLRNEIDWVGAMIACASLAMFSYVLAIISTDSSNIDQPASIVILVLSLILMILFPVWMSYQTRHGRPALIPNQLWKNLTFTCICVLTVFTWGVCNSMELFSSLYFQEIQHHSALTASLQILPALAVGTILNFATGYLVDRAPIFWVVLIATCLTSGSPLLMALIDPIWPYWWGAFPAQILAPISTDILFTVGLIIVSEVFPEKTQALAGAVYNTVAYFGMSLGINLMQVVSMLVTKGTTYRDKESPAALLQGYRASFWAMFAATVTCVLLSILGMRNIGKVGLKRE